MQGYLRTSAERMRISHGHNTICTQDTNLVRYSIVADYRLFDIRIAGDRGVLSVILAMDLIWAAFL